MPRGNSVLAFAREAGGAAAIAPVCKRILDLNIPLLLLSDDKGLDIFKARGLHPNAFSFNESELESLCQKHFKNHPSHLLTSAASLPHLDMTERYLWQWASKQNILSTAILDQWQNYAIRFSGEKPEQHLAYLPDRICVMDELARTEMIKQGIPESRIIVTGQPSFDWLREQNKSADNQTISHLNDLQLSNSNIIVTFVSEALAKDFGNTLGYDEISTVKVLGDILSKINLPNLGLIIKLHPQNNKSDFSWCMEAWPNLNTRIVGNEYSPPQILALSDVVIGMSSVMLVEAVITEKAVISLELNAKHEPQLSLTRCGILPFIKNAHEAEKLIHNLLSSAENRTAHIQHQNKWSNKYQATDNCLIVLGII
ncbi:MAG: hypothetical protein HWE34_05965 [Methylocystaceae bacterium]|nr:hypothetical protein [Methylocystaceae bacterium]